VNKEIIEDLYEVFKDQWKFMQKYKIQREKHLRKTINDTALLLNLYNDPNLRISEFLRSLNSPKSQLQESIRSSIKLQTICLEKEELEFPFKEEEAEDKVVKSYPLTMGQRIITCQQFAQDLLLNLYFFMLNFSFLVENKEYFILLKPDYNNLTQASVVVMTKLTNVELKIDFNCSKKALVSIRNIENEAEDVEERILYFDDEAALVYYQKQFESHCREINKRRGELVLDYLGSCKSRI